MGAGEPEPEAVDYYARIGVRPDADAETVERRRKQADRRFSPMSSSPEADEKRHMQINAASNVLEDPEERARYDHCYEAFGPNRGTAVYETLSTSVLDAVREEAMLADHLRGFVEIVGPVRGAREFATYYEEMEPTSPEGETDADLPNGYAVADAGFGVAAWSFRQAGKPCDRDRWLAGGRDLWRTALVDPDSVEEMIADIEARSEQRPSTATTTVEAESTDPEETPTTRIRGHPSSGAPTQQLPNEYAPTSSGRDRDSDRRDTGGRATDSGVAAYVRPPVQRVAESLAYVGVTGAWGSASLGASALAGLGGLAVAATAFLPLLALALLIQSALPGVDTAVQSAAGVPLASTDAPFETATLVHYLAMGLLAVVPAALSARFVVPWIDGRKRRGLPDDAWLVFAIALASLAGVLVVGVREGALSRPVAVGATTVLTAFTFQAALDVGGARWLARLCTAVATLGFGVASSAAGIAIADFGLRAVDPALAAASTERLLALPLVASPLVGIANAELVVVGLAALAVVPLALTTLYSLAYKIESLTFRLRSRAHW